MSQKERRRLAVFARVGGGQLTVAAAGRLRGISERRARALCSVNEGLDFPDLPRAEVTPKALAGRGPLLLTGGVGLANFNLRTGNWGAVAFGVRPLKSEFRTRVAGSLNR